jgi:hypothetical protein
MVNTASACACARKLVYAAVQCISVHVRHVFLLLAVTVTGMIVFVLGSHLRDRSAAGLSAEQTEKEAA